MPKTRVWSLLSAYQSHRSVNSEVDHEHTRRELSGYLPRLAGESGPKMSCRNAENKPPAASAKNNSACDNHQPSDAQTAMLSMAQDAKQEANVQGAAKAD